MKNSLKSRFGIFFIILGVGVLLVFISHFIAHEISFDYLALGIIFILIGVTMIERPQPPEESARFATIRKLREKSAAKSKKKS